MFPPSVALRTKAVAGASALLLAALPGRGALAQEAAGTLVGVVQLEGSSAPAAGAEVGLVGMDRRFRADGDGEFLFLELAPGDYHLEVRYGGFLSNRLAVSVPGGRITHVEVSVAAAFPENPRYELEPMTVEVSRSSQKLRGFERRREERMGGVFFTRADIEEASPVYPSDLLRGLSGVRVARGLEGTEIRMGHGALACEPFLYVDGTPSHAVWLDHYLPRLIEALEVYRRPLERPPQFRQGSCGAILLWTRENAGRD